MRRLMSRAVIASGIALAMCAPIAAPGTLAQTASVAAWATIDTTNPAPGCNVGVVVELHEDGGASAGTDVSLALTVDATGDVVGSDRGVTDDSGIAYLSYDTSSAAAGDKMWLELHVNGAYVGGKTVMVDGESCDGDVQVVDFSGDVPVSSTDNVDTGASSEGAESSGAVILPNVSAYQQQRPLSCEYASLSIATGALGNWISEYDFDNIVGWSDNPHWGYRGDINGVWGGTDDYGVYAEALVPALNQFGFNGEVFYGGHENLINAIDQGKPTLVWIGLWGDQSIYPTASDGTTYQVTAGDHVVVVYGYDDGGVYVSDPGTGTLHYYDWGTFDSIWSVMDQMALAVSW